MRFLHTADWQLGMKAAHVGEVGNRVREERLHAVNRIIEAAQTHKADFILIAGDTFEDNGVDRVLIQKAVDILSGFGAPVYIIPGNHDPLVPGSVWEHPIWKQTENMVLLQEEKPVEVPGGLLYPCPVKEKYSQKNPVEWIRADQKEEIQIGVSHGTVEGVHQEEPDYPIPRDSVEQAGLDYLALGHWHSTALYHSSDGAVRMAYAGTHEPTRFGERDSGNVIIVDIEEPGALPKVTSMSTGRLIWQELEADLRMPGDLRSFREEIEALETPETTLVKVVIHGILAAEERSELDRIREILNARVLFYHLEMSGIRVSPEDESWLAHLPPGILRDVAHRLQEWTDPQFGGQRPEEASPEVASQALFELYALLGEEAS